MDQHVEEDLAFLDSCGGNNLLYQSVIKMMIGDAAFRSLVFRTLFYRVLEETMNVFGGKEHIYNFLKLIFRHGWVEAMPGRPAKKDFYNVYMALEEKDLYFGRLVQLANQIHLKLGKHDAAHEAVLNPLSLCSLAVEDNNISFWQRYENLVS